MPFHLELGHQTLSPSPGTPSGRSKEEGVKELKFSDGKRTEDQTSSLVTSRCWDAAAPQPSRQFHPSVGRGGRSSSRLPHLSVWRHWCK
ncbi:hypothetical protein AV530_009383 [Patagioenas fasciata monilis]|uniref:Uncharacterized protein n=1 Tax=Patagioenas fasciata monilis TaxID=372326 RepID=A0A1V4JJ40_PATFA|nr:hypothetical protein AV530_009383 [Patagioenas fasciata monilis]